MPHRFAILDHDWPYPHKDLLLEFEAVLRAWRLPVEFDGMVAVTATALPDHRLIYLDYEGPVSDGRGTVTRWDAGTLEWIDDTRFQLMGTKVTGVFQIVSLNDSGISINPEPVKSCEL